MANVFVHFEPIGPIDGAPELTGDLPPYLIPGSPDEPTWRSLNPNGHVLVTDHLTDTGATEAHRYAQSNDIKSLTAYLDKVDDAVSHRDSNGWTPLVEAVRTGNVEMVKLLVERGSEVNDRTGPNGEGGSVLWWTNELVGMAHPVYEYLKEVGAREIEPGSGSSSGEL
jgi:hypothetical protein